jgi:hypothetical protein
MKSVLKSLCCAAILSLLGVQASANVVQLTWATTVESVEGVHPGIAGESLTTIFRVDNGGSTLTSQTWGIGSFLSYRQQGASGWFFESTDLSGLSKGSFSTDATGNVVSAPDWFGNYPTGTAITSWAGPTLGAWWNNGNNATSCDFSPFYFATFTCVNATNVEQNLLGASWSAALVPTDGVSVPEPATLALLTFGLLGLAMTRRRPS